MNNLALQEIYLACLRQYLHKVCLTENNYATVYGQFCSFHKDEEVREEAIEIRNAYLNK